MDIKRMIKSDDSAFIAELNARKYGKKHIFWISDLHGDSVHSHTEFIDKLFKEYPDALMIVGGDHLDVMQNIRDPRASKSSLRTDLKEDEYLNKLIDWNVEYWDKYAHRIMAFFIGNHEYAQIRHYGINLSRLIVERLNERNGTNILLGDLAGWLKLRFDVHGRFFTRNINFRHKPKSGGTRSKGTLSIDLIKGEYPDGDIYISEHIHDTWIKPERVETLTTSGKVKYKRKWFIQAPTLKDEFSGQKVGYTHLRGYGATPVAVIVIEFNVHRRGVSILTPDYAFVKDE